MKSSLNPLTILAEVKRLEFVTRGAVETLLKGSYKSTFRGQGLEFHQVREYYPEDDVRSIDWNVTARLNAPFVKTFVEERELQMVLAVDLSASLWSGSGPNSKRETALRLCATLAFSATKNQDRVGLFLFTDRAEYWLPPKRGKAAGMRILRELLQFKPAGTKTNYKPAFKTLSQVVKRRSVLVLVSDFTEPVPVELAGFLARRHDMVAVVVKDPVETKYQLPARVAVRDPETGKVGYLVPGSTKAFKKADEFREKQLQVLTRQGSDRMDLTAGENVILALMRFFKKRFERSGRR
jgi:uncharacterized protein (DUF58 family)